MIKVEHNPTMIDIVMASAAGIPKLPSTYTAATSRTPQPPTEIGILAAKLMMAEAANTDAMGIPWLTAKIPSTKHPSIRSCPTSVKPAITITRVRFTLESTRPDNFFSNLERPRQRLNAHPPQAAITIQAGIHHGLHAKTLQH